MYVTLSLYIYTAAEYVREREEGRGVGVGAGLKAVGGFRAESFHRK